jgi:hypothetical protein
LLGVAFFASGVRTGILQSRFAHVLRASEPSLWKDLATWHRWNDNSDMHESAVMSFVLQGAFRTLRDSGLVRLGASCRRWYMLTFAALVVLGTHATLTQIFLPVSCLWRARA